MTQDAPASGPDARSHAKRAALTEDRLGQTGTTPLTRPMMPDLDDEEDR